MVSILGEEEGRLNLVETMVINYCLGLANCKEMNLKQELTSIRINSRDMTGVGFFTEFERIDCLKVSNKTNDYTWPLDLTLKLNCFMLTGYIAYVKDGYLETIEGHLYNGESWPENIRAIEVTDM